MCRRSPQPANEAVSVSACRDPMVRGRRAVAARPTRRNARGLGRRALARLAGWDIDEDDPRQLGGRQPQAGAVAHQEQRHETGLRRRPHDQGDHEQGAGLETSKLLVELLQEGTPGWRSQTRGPAAGSLSPHAIRAAIHVYQHGTVTIGQLGDGLGISQGWASRLVDDMVRSGHLVRERDPDDRRVYRVRLSPIAVESVEHAYRWRGDAVEAVLADLSPEQRAGVRRFLRRFIDRLSSGD